MSETAANAPTYITYKGIYESKTYSPWARYWNPPHPRGIFWDNDFWIAEYVSFQYLLVCKMNYSAFRGYLRWYIAA